MHASDLPSGRVPEPSGPAPSSRRTALRALVMGAGALLAGCVVAPIGPGYGPYRSEEGPETDVAPPPPQYEVVPVAPGPAYVWIGGYWTWHLGRYLWIGGRWALPPAGYAWAPGYWDRRGPRWRWNGGYWRRR